MTVYVQHSKNKFISFLAEMADTVKTLTPMMEKLVGPNLLRSDIPVLGGRTPVDSTENVDATTLTEDVEEPGSQNTQVASGKECQNIDQCSLQQPAQLKALTTNCRRPLFNAAKRKLSYEHLHEIPTSRICDNLTEPSQINDDWSSQKQQCSTDEQSETSSVISKGSCDEMESVKASRQIQSSPNFSLSCKAPSCVKSISPLTKAFKSFHMQGSHSTALELQQSSYSLSATASNSPPVMIPSFSVPCLLSPHPMPQTFILDTPPLQSRISKSPSLVSASQELLACSVGSNSERNSDVSQYISTRVQMGQQSSGMGATISYNNAVYTIPTASNTNCSFSMTSDITSPNPACSESQSAYGKSSSNMTLESMLRGHRKSAGGLRSPNINVNSQSSYSVGTQLKQVLMQGSSQQCMQQQTQPSLRCPRTIHCNNCGHKIDLKTYLQSQQKTGNSEALAPAHKSIPTKSSITNAGLTAFDLETICDTGYIDSTSTIGKQQCRRGNHLMFCCITNGDYEISSSFDKLPSSTRGGITKSYFPHSDELTRSFAPILSDTVDESTLAECWGKLDTLDVDEMLQLLEATSDMRYCSNPSTCKGVASSKLYGQTPTGKETTLKSVRLAKHIFTEEYTPCRELHSSSGKTSQSGKSGGKSRGKSTGCPNVNCRNGTGKSGSSNSDGEVVQCEESNGGRILRSRARQSTSRICKKRSRKKQSKKTSYNNKNNKQKAIA